MAEEGKDYLTEPRFDIIDKLYSKIEVDLETVQKEEKLTFFEIEVALMMIKEKLNQEKYEIYSNIKSDIDSGVPKKDVPDGFYK